MKNNTKKPGIQMSGELTEGVCGKKAVRLLSRLGFDEPYTGSPTHAQVNRWLRDKHDMHVMPLPDPYWKWKVMIVLLGKPNTKDGKLNATILNDKVFETYDDAMEAGILFYLEDIAPVGEKIQKHELSGQDIEKMKDELRAQGFDL